MLTPHTSETSEFFFGMKKMWVNLINLNISQNSLKCETQYSLSVADWSKRCSCKFNVQPEQPPITTHHPPLLLLLTRQLRSMSWRLSEEAWTTPAPTTGVTGAAFLQLMDPAEVRTLNLHHPTPTSHSSYTILTRSSCVALFIKHI